MSEKDGGRFWSFGFGSNMDVAYVEKQKGVTILDRKPAVLHGYRLTFNHPGYALVEPAFANVKEDQDSEVHGVAFCMTKESMDKIIRVEPPEYMVQMVTLKAYDGDDLKGFIFISDPDLREYAPSKRYLGIIIDGARRAGLQPSYLTKLESHPTYSPPDWVLKMRAERPELSDLPPLTVKELAEHRSDDDSWFSIMGYVVKPVEAGFFKNFRGKDITTSIYLHYNKLAWYGSVDDGGHPPYPLLRDMDAASREYLMQFLDHYHAGSSHDGVANMGRIVGHLVEFKQQQDSGVTTWTKPEKKD